MRYQSLPVAVAMAACLLAFATNSILAARARALLQQDQPLGGSSAQQPALTSALKTVSDNIKQQLQAAQVAPVAPPFEYESSAPAAVAYGPDGTPYLVIPAGAAAAAGSGGGAGAVQQVTGAPAAAPAIQAPASAAAPAAATSSLALSNGTGDVEPRVEAAGGALLLKHLVAAAAQSPAPAAQPAVIVVPAAIQPTQLAAAATPAPTQAAGPFTPTTVGSGGIRIVNSNPISISTPVKNVNPSLVKSMPSVLGLLGGATNLLGGLFGGKP